LLHRQLLSLLHLHHVMLLLGLCLLLLLELLALMLVQVHSGVLNVKGGACSNPRYIFQACEKACFQKTDVI